MVSHLMCSNDADPIFKKPNKSLPIASIDRRVSLVQIVQHDKQHAEFAIMHEVARYIC